MRRSHQGVGVTLPGLLSELRQALWAEHLTGLPLLASYRDAFIRELDAAMTMPPMPQSTKERQEALRARRLMLGQTEVRGIYLPPDLHAELKAHARKLAKKVSATAPTQKEPNSETMRKSSEEDR
jgi:hypothetical protein